MIKFKELVEGKFDKSAVKDHIKTMSPDMFTKLYGKTKAQIRDELKEETLDEVLSKDAAASEWIHDFIHSDNPKFAGKSKEKRKEMALAAYYAKQRNEEVELEEAVDPSEIASNPRMYSADSAKKAYYHKNASASDKESLAKHLDRHHGNKEWRKPVKENAPVAPTLDRKYIKGTPENKAHKEKNKPINGHPTNTRNEGYDMTDEQMLEELKSLSHEQLLELSQQLDELKKTTVKSYITKKMDSIYKTSAPPSISYVKKTTANLQRAHDRNTGVKPTSEEVELSEAGGVGDSLGHLTAAERAREIARRKAKIASNTTPANKKFVEKALSGKPVKEEAELDEGIFKGTAEVVKQAVRVPYRAVKRVAGAVLDTAHDVGDAAKNIKKKFKEDVELDEAFINGREYASNGLMHPDHAKMDIHKVSGNHVDFYASKTGDKMQGKVIKNDGKQVHIQAHKELGDGKLHKFKVSSSLPKQNNEEFENGELETTMKSYKDFLTSIDEALWPGTPEYKKKFPDSTRGKVGSETKTSSGTSTVTTTGVKHERDYDKAEKETTEQPTGNMAKRGRGRPAGSKSGARR